jgi:hypothetical protein
VPGNTDQTLHDLLVFALTALIVAYALRALVAGLRRRRPDLAIGRAVGAAVVIRLIAASGTSLTGIGDNLRGFDEKVFYSESQGIAHGAQGAVSYTHALIHQLYEFVLAVQIRLFDSPDVALRLGEIGIAVAGLALLATAVYELAGARAAFLAMALLAIEPTNIFFTTLLHKEALMLLATGLVAFGGALLWRRDELRGLPLMVFGCLMALPTRHYAGLFLIAASGAILLHVALRAERRGSARSFALISAAALAAAITIPLFLQASNQEGLAGLQGSQEANVEQPAAEGNNLGLERVDFSTRSAVLLNLPIRIRDVLLRPYPWEVGNVSQQLGLLGTIVAWIVYAQFIRWAYRSRGTIMQRAGPFMYLAFFTLIAYSLSAGNAGTAFRYRTHVIALALCAVVVLRQKYLEHASEPRAQPAIAGAPSGFVLERG